MNLGTLVTLASIHTPPPTKSLKKSARVVSFKTPEDEEPSKRKKKARGPGKKTVARMKVLDKLRPYKTHLFPRSEFSSRGTFCQFFFFYNQKMLDKSFRTFTVPEGYLVLRIK